MHKLTYFGEYSFLAQVHKVNQDVIMFFYTQMDSEEQEIST
jgi:hypothetical protein